MVKTYLFNLQKELITGNALEHSYRPALKHLIEQIDKNIIAVNEPSRSTFGSPDFVFFRKSNSDIISGYGETKDIYTDLNEIEKTAQLKKYLGYSNLLLTNYIEFRFFRNGKKYQTIAIANKEGSFLRPIEENCVFLEKELGAFLEGKPEYIHSGKRLAEIMGGKAARIRENVKKFITEEKTDEMARMYKVVRDLLVHDLTTEKFADMYAQTLVYGLFVARYYDNTPEDFSRQEARDLVPISNPFLRHFFDHIVGPNFDKRLGYIVDELCEVFSIADIRNIIQRHFNLFGELEDKDPIIHFYEDFLREYDPELRKTMGAYYTPVPVVNFMIRAIDSILKTEFNIAQGIASNEKIQRTVITQGIKSKEIVHKVQILDPAVGTATFLNEIIKHISKTFKGQEGNWHNYVENELLNRLFGFELMMAPYTIAHLKLAMTLKETGINTTKRRIGVYLTNTLEEGIEHKDELFNIGLTEAISEESKMAGVIKNSKPIMVIIGNPPYSGVSSNNTKYANKLVEKYKVEPGGTIKLKERKHWLNDDYVKFIAFSEDLINKNGEGIIALITNHGYIDNPTFRGMRWHLTQTFNKIFILNLHGNVKKSEKAPDNSKDENVFNIQQGVSIIIATKTKEGKGRTEVNLSDLWGERESKMLTLNKSTLSDLAWSKLTLNKTNYSFVQNTDNRIKKKYEAYISLNDLFLVKSTGILTMGDNFITSDSKEELAFRLNQFVNTHLSENDLQKEYHLGKNYAKWIIANKNQIQINEKSFYKVAYRPFENKWIYLDNRLVWRSRIKVTANLIDKDNVALDFCRQAATNQEWSLIFVTNKAADDSFISNRTKERGYEAPLYLYDNEQSQNLIKTSNRSPNLDMKFVRLLLKNVKNYSWIDDHNNKINQNEISPLDILDYIYAVLYSPKFRNEFKDVLRNDFPRVPPASNRELFDALAKLGSKLRTLHLLKAQNVNITTTFPISSSNKVESIRYISNKVWINDQQYFGDVPVDVWDLRIGAYQPAQKWLKTHIGRYLNYEEIVYYQKMLSILSETIMVAKEIDKVIESNLKLV